MKTYVHDLSQPDKCSRFFNERGEHIKTEWKAIRLEIQPVQFISSYKEPSRKMKNKEVWNKKKKQKYCKNLNFESLKKKPILGMVQNRNDVQETQFIDNVLSV